MLGSPVTFGTAYLLINAQTDIGHISDVSDMTYIIVSWLVRANYLRYCTTNDLLHDQLKINITTVTLDQKREDAVTLWYQDIYLQTAVYI